jgi:hypothetical protein
MRSSVHTGKDDKYFAELRDSMMGNWPVSRCSDSDSDSSAASAVSEGCSDAGALQNTLDGRVEVVWPTVDCIRNSLLVGIGIAG